MIWTKAVLSFFFDKLKCVPINKTMSSEHNISARGKRTKFTVWVPNTITLQYEIPFLPNKKAYSQRQNTTSEIYDIGEREKHNTLYSW